MNKEQLLILGAFDATMQTFTEVWQDPNTTIVQATLAYGGAAAMLILVKQTTDINEKAQHAARLLNEAAVTLGMPPNN